MDKRWRILAFVAVASSFVASCGGESGVEPVIEIEPFCESTQCPEGTVCNEERKMCVTIPKGNGETDPCDECTDEQECVNGTCVDKKPVTEPEVNPCDKCTAEQECIEGACVDKDPEPPAQLCSDSEKPKCNGNAVVSCVDGQYVPKDCENQECKNGKCVDKVDPNKCDPATFKNACEQNSVISCVDGMLHSEPCPNGQYCDGGECFDTDYCPDNPDKMVAGVCGCALPDTDLNGNGTVDCLEIEDLCPDDSEKTSPGQCGCNVPETACGEVDLCPENEGKTVPGVCGCEADDTDTDGDGIPDCIDICPDNPYKFKEDTCACEFVHVSIDDTDYCAVPIGTAQEFVDLVNGIADESLAVTTDSVYAVMRDINLVDVLAADTEWKPVTFKGKLASGGDTVKTIAYTDAEGERMALHCGETDASCGLFGTLTGARIDNIQLNLGVSGINKLGGLAGVADGNTKLTRIKALTDINGGGSDIGGVIGYGSQITLSGIEHQGKVINIGENTSAVPVANTGGIVGKLVSNSTLSDSRNVGRVVSQSENVTSTAYSLGGLVGRAESGTTLVNLTNDSMVSTQTCIYIGGIIGYHTGISKTGNKNLTNNGYVKGYQYVGGIFGRIDNVSGAEGITDSVNNGTVAGLWQCTGGIAGYSYIPLTRVINHGTVSGSTYIGGISGVMGNSANYAYNDGLIWGENAQQGCGTYIGGLFGQINGGYAHSYLTNHGQVTADWAPRMAVSGTTGVQSADDCPNRYFAGIVGYVSDGNGTKITNVLNTGNITTSMSGLGRAGGIAGWAHSLSLINAKNTGGLKGNALVGGIVGRLFLRGNSSSKKFPFEWRNIENTGKILSNGERTGGIIGDLYIENEQTVCSFDQIVNRGTVSSSASRVGGIIGNIKENNKTATFKNIFNMGNIKGASYVGGIVGFANSNTDDFWEGESFRYLATGERTMTYTFDTCVSTGDITTNGSHVGGLLGYIVVPSIAAYGKTITKPNEHTKIEASANSYSVSRCEHNNNIYTRTIDLQYYNSNSILNLQNSYFSGNITETGTGSNFGGLIGYIDARSLVSPFTNTIKAYDSECNPDNKASTSYTVTRLAQTNIKNSYSLGTITSNHANTGGLFGRLLTKDGVADTDAYKKQIMGDGKKTVSILTNAYSAASLANLGSSVAGYQDDTSTLTISNVYSLTGSSTNNLIWGNKTSIGGHSAFSFNEGGSAVVGSDNLIDKLNATATSLKLTAWKNASYTLPNNKKVTVPSFDVKPQLETWEAWEGK